MVSLITNSLSVMKDITVGEAMLINGYIKQLGKLFIDTPEKILCLLHLFHHIPVESIVEVYRNNYTDDHIGYGSTFIDPEYTNYNVYQWLLKAKNCDDMYDEVHDNYYQH